MPQGLSGILDSNIHPTLVAYTVRCNNFAGDRNHSVNHRLPLRNWTAGQVDGLQVSVQRFRSGVTRFPFLLTSLAEFVILLLHCQGTVLYCCYIDFWNGQETKTHHTRPRHTSCPRGMIKSIPLAFGVPFLMAGGF
jgi:hypothetical protein